MATTIVKALIRRQNIGSSAGSTGITSTTSICTAWEGQGLETVASQALRGMFFYVLFFFDYTNNYLHPKSSTTCPTSTQRLSFHLDTSKAYTDTRTFSDL
jgi:hypothetical protein